MFSFKYSPRPKTLAGQRMVDDVPEPEKTRRIVALQAVQKEMQWGLFQAAIGSTQQVLVDGVSKRRETELAGRTSGNTIVNFPGDAALLGHLVDVRITGAGPNSLKGELARAGEAAAANAPGEAGEDRVRKQLASALVLTSTAAGHSAGE
jgi:tRNA-2-methylthio-N6-dimethylallyladenosine synthase